MNRVRALPVALGLSLAATGLLGSLANELASPERAISVGQAAASPLGARVLVRGLLEEVRSLKGGAAIATVTDCAERRLAVYFPGGAPEGAAWRLALLDGKVEPYAGDVELVVDRPLGLRPAGEGALAVEPGDLAEGWRAFLCRPVALHAPVLWARTSAGDARTAELGVDLGGRELLALVHLDAPVHVVLAPGAAVTLVGVVAAQGGAGAPVLHVRG